MSDNRVHPNPFRQDENNIRMENDPRVEGVNKLI